MCAGDGLLAAVNPALHGLACVEGVVRVLRGRESAAGEEGG